MGRRETLITVTAAGELLTCMYLKYYLSFRETPGWTVYSEFKTSAGKSFTDTNVPECMCTLQGCKQIQNTLFGHAQWRTCSEIFVPNPDVSPDWHNLTLTLTALLLRVLALSSLNTQTSSTHRYNQTDSLFTLNIPQGQKSIHTALVA